MQKDYTVYQIPGLKKPQGFVAEENDRVTGANANVVSEKAAETGDIRGVAGEKAAEISDTVSNMTESASDVYQELLMIGKEIEEWRLKNS